MADRMDPIAAKVTKMNMAQGEEASGKHTVVRTIVGSELVRELQLN